ncbi:hypothetical protein BGW36DRAFT_401501 [Talaromyces proteolyticus]|uniref:Dihydrodipicolinate synthase n=1 Tax=Talaromyces proteolyticus TaxID=1131652 RepID=A0AAD4KK30_9EURO|nr:uncharacterized protein BGW36DRAFT_401501 [Talaromyces proteolyticus]KAH8690064.1 hypothetical protein BGW36DRAFT_401501 [Talaromyces proteolyticus]
MTPTNPRYGVYTLVVIFFSEDESIDLEGTKTHALVLLSSKREMLIRTVRSYLINLGYLSLQLIVGCSAPSAGTDFVLVLPLAYWTTSTTPPVIEGFFSTVAENSPLPVLIYNFPSVIGGMDISSDSIIRLAQKNPNIFGVKLTCGNPFATFGGKLGFFLSALVARSHSIITALANVMPRTHGNYADWALSKVGVAGVKGVVSHYFGYGTAQGRRPLELTLVSKLSIDALERIQQLIDIENGL